VWSDPVSSPPSNSATLTVTNFPSPCCDTYTIVLPSGDQTNAKSSAVEVVRMRGSPPVAGTTAMSWFPFLSVPKASIDPSGDQRAGPSYAGSEVMRVGDPPAAGMTKMSNARSVKAP